MGRNRHRLGPALFFGLLAFCSLVILSRADTSLGPSSYPRQGRRLLPSARTASSAFGRSRAVRMVMALPSARVDLPLELGGSPVGLEYEWVPVGSLAPVSLARPLEGPIFAPPLPGFYRLAIVTGGNRRVLDSLTMGVLKPLADKRGSTMNGYRMGFYRGERRGAAKLAPPGFLEVTQDDLGLPVSQHLTVEDFITHDAQTSWPRYVAMDPRLLDKLELVFEEILRWRGSPQGGSVDVSVRSGFRTPLHNRRVPRAATDSRHQFGDAADVAVDANGDGKVTWVDVGLIARAVEAVERGHPDLVGGLGTYHRKAPYAHIDVRGRRVRWRG